MGGMVILGLLIDGRASELGGDGIQKTMTEVAWPGHV